MQVTIRPLQEIDAFTSVLWRNDPEVFKYTGNTYNHEITLENEIAWIRKVMSNSDDYRCAIEVNGIYVGNIYITGISQETGEYHIFIGDKNWWGKGVATQASKLMLQHAFSQLNLQYITLRVRIANQVAIRLYNKIGFKEIERDSDWITMIIKKETTCEK